MSSLLGSRDEITPTRSGGKIIRKRSRTTPSPSPYARPQETSPEAAQLKNPSWFSGLFTGAGKIISSVLPSRASSPDEFGSSDEYISSDEEGGEGSKFDEDEEENVGFEKAGKSENKCMNELHETVPKSETKRAIEQMVKKETFSRAECDRLIKLIQSRVIHSSSQDICRDGTENLRRTTIHQESSLPSSLKQNFTERVPHLSEPFVLEACTPDLHSKAMLEAKIWLKERKSASKTENCSKICTSNNKYGFDDSEISPVDIAKSYMKSLPPWRSPTYSGYEAPPSRLKCYRDNDNEIYNATTAIDLPSAEGRTRDHFDFATLGTSNEVRRLRSRRIYQSDISKSKNSEKSAKTPEHVNNKSVNANEASQIKISSSDCNGNVNQAIETTNLNSSSNLSEPELITSTVHETVEISLSDGHPLEPTQPSEELPCKEGGDKISVSHGTVTSASRLVEHDRNTSLEKEVVTVAENKEPAVLCKSINVEELNDVETLSQQTSTGVEDRMPQDKTCHISNETNGSIASMDSLFTEAKADFVHETQSEAINKLMYQNGTETNPSEMLPSEPKEKAVRRSRKPIAKSRRARKS